MAAKPRRNYRGLIESLRQVWRIETLSDDDAIWGYGLAERSSFAAARPLRVCIWNMCKGVGGRLFDHDFRSLLFGADLLLAQEALLSERSLQTFRQPGFQLVHGASYKRSDGLRDGVLTMTKAALIGSPRRIICKYPEPIFKTPKAALATLIPWEGLAEPLLVVNLHATLVRTISGAIAEIAHLFASLPAHRGPIILAGDFNTFSNGYRAAIISELRSLGLEQVPIPGDPRSTLGQLDLLFVRGLRARWAVVDTTIRNSDHFPLVAELEVLPD